MTFTLVSYPAWTVPQPGSTGAVADPLSAFRMTDDERRTDDVFPEFTRYTPAQDGGVQVGDASEVADGLRQALRIPAGYALFVIAL